MVRNWLAWSYTDLTETLFCIKCEDFSFLFPFFFFFSDIYWLCKRAILADCILYVIHVLCQGLLKGFIILTTPNLYFKKTVKNKITGKIHLQNLSCQLGCRKPHAVRKPHNECHCFGLSCSLAFCIYWYYGIIKTFIKRMQIH